MTNQPHIALDASMGPTVPELVSVLEPFVRRNEDGSFVAPKDEALSDLITLAVSMQKTLASLPQQTAEPVAESDLRALNNRITDLLIVGNRLSFAAQTTGGTAGRDDELVQRIAEWKVEADKAKAIQRIVKFEPASPPVGGALDGINPKLVKYVEMLRAECAYKGPCSDNGDGCTCSAEELNARHMRALRGSALASSERSGREAALIEAAEELLEHMDDYGHIGGVDVLPLRDAVAAIRNLAGTKTNG